MPSPVGHVLGALAVREALGSSLTLSETAILAVLADVDFAYGAAAIGRTEQAHGHATHSLAAMVLAGASSGILAQRRHRGRVAFDAATIYASHLLLDALGKESEDGLPLLWPMSHKRYSLDLSIFSTIQRSRGRRFLPGLWNRNNRRAVVREVMVLLGPLVLGIAVGRLARK